MTDIEQPAQLYAQPYPQAGRERLIMPQPVAWKGTGEELDELAIVARLNPKTVMMMGDNTALPKMPAAPTLLDFFRCRITGLTSRHLLVSAHRALSDGLPEKIVLACLLHDIANGCLIRSDHGYWGAQLIAPYVDEEIAWAVQHHQALRYFADPEAGYEYPDSYRLFFGEDYQPPEYIARAAEEARAHRWYGTARAITLYDTYFFDDYPEVAEETFTDLIARHFRQPAEGLGFDGSPVAHMWRTMIWPNNFL